MNSEGKLPKVRISSRNFSSTLLNQSSVRLMIVHGLGQHRQDLLAALGASAAR